MAPQGDHLPVVDKVVDVIDSSPRKRKLTLRHLGELRFPPGTTFQDVVLLVRDTLLEEKWTIVGTLVGVLLILLLQFAVTSPRWHDLPDGAWTTIWVLFFAFVFMIRGFTDPDICLFGATAVLLLSHVIVPKDAWAGFGNDSIVTIGIMIAIAAGLEATGALNVLAKYVLGRTRVVWLAQVKLWITVCAISAFMNNTPLVAVFIPVVQRYCRETSVPASKMMIPTSYAAIFGGLCTIIGTSTNLIVKGLAEADAEAKPPKGPALEFGFFEIGIVGLPMVVIGLVYIIFVSPWLLPVRTPVEEKGHADPRHFVATVQVKKAKGINLDKAGYIGLQGLKLLRVTYHSNGTELSKPQADAAIAEGDRMTFSGNVHNLRTLLQLDDVEIDDTLRHDGLAQLEEQVLVEVILSQKFPVLGQSIYQSSFRERYHSNVIAVRRNGQPVDLAVSNIVLETGDSLLLETTVSFVENYKYSSEFVAVITHESLRKPMSYVKLAIAVALFGMMIGLNSSDAEELSVTGLTVLIIYFFTRVLPVQGFRDSIPGMVLLTVAGAFGLAKALTDTKVAKALGDTLVDAFGGMGATLGPLFAVYLTTAILTALLSNGASVTLMFPIAREMAKRTGIAHKAFYYLIMLSASADFSTPIGYQTNLMVYAPGGYQFLDYTKFGLPLQILHAIVSVGVGIAYWA